MAETTRYLLIYNHAAEAFVVEPQVFVGDAQVMAALDAYDKAEDEYADRRDHIEVLLVGADSLDSVKVTHSRFFRTAARAG